MIGTVIALREIEMKISVAAGSHSASIHRKFYSISANFQVKIVSKVRVSCLVSDSGSGEWRSGAPRFSWPSPNHARNAIGRAVKTSVSAVELVAWSSES